MREERERETHEENYGQKDKEKEMKSEKNR